MKIKRMGVLIIVAVFFTSLLLVLASVGRYLSSRKTDSIGPLVVNQKKEIVIQTIKWNGRVIEAVASDSNFEGADERRIVIREKGNLIEDDLILNIFTHIRRGYSDDRVMNIVGNKLYLVNYLSRAITVYNIDNESYGYAPKLTFLIDHEIPLPQYEIGDVYGINCDKNVCKVNTAFHLESGCDMDLNLKTEKFSNIYCTQMGGTEGNVEITPEPIKIKKPTPTERPVNDVYKGSKPSNSNTLQNISYTLTPGWAAIKKIEENRDLGIKAEVIIISKGNYKIYIGSLQTGASYCDIDSEHQLVTLRNQYLGKKVTRGNPDYALDIIKPNDDYSLLVKVCSNYFDKNSLRTIDSTEIGPIIYEIPEKGYEDSVLRDMDKIIESIKPIN